MYFQGLSGETFERTVEEQKLEEKFTSKVVENMRKIYIKLFWEMSLIFVKLNRKYENEKWKALKNNNANPENKIMLREVSIDSPQPRL